MTKWFDSTVVRRIAVAGVAIAATVSSATGAGAVSSPQGVVVSADPVNITPHVLNGTVYGIAEVGSKIVVAGEFTSVRNTNTQLVQYQANVFSYDKVTGRIDQAFFPQVNGRVNTVAADPSGNSVFIGGVFTTVNGVAQQKLVKLDIATGQLVTAFRAGVAGSVNDLKVSNGRLFIGGQFSKVRGIARTNLASVDPTTGAVDAELNLAANKPGSSSTVLKLDVTPNGGRLVAIGSFTHVGGVARARVAVIDRTTSPDTVSAWSSSRFDLKCPSAGTGVSWLRDVEFDPTGTYFAIGTTGGWGGTNGNRLCDAVSRWEMVDAPGRLPTWINETGGDTVLSVAVTDVAVYVGGHQRWMNNEDAPRSDRAGSSALDRSGIAAVDPTTGRALTWNPGRTRGLGVRDLVGTTTGLLVGSDTDSLGGEFHARLGMFPVAGGAAPVIDRSRG